MKIQSMSKRTAAKIASVVLFIHGFIELSAILGLIVPVEFIPEWFQESPVFFAILSGIYGVSRIIAGCAIWSMRKWGVVFGMTLSIISIIGAPSVYAFGVMDLILAIIVLISLLYMWFGNEKL